MALGGLAWRRAWSVPLLLAASALAGCVSGRPPDLPHKSAGERAAAFEHVAAVAGAEGDTEAAERLYRGAIHDRPEWVAPKIGLAHMLLRRGDIEGARALFTQAARLAPGNGHAVAGLAEVTLAEHHPRAALKGFERALRLTPGDTIALNGSGVALDQLGEHAEAQLRYREILAREPDNGPAQNNLALSLALDGHATQAVQILSTLAQNPGALPRTRQNLAVALALLGRDKDAIATASVDESPAVARSDVALLEILRQGLSPGVSSSPASATSPQKKDDLPPSS